MNSQIVSNIEHSGDSEDATTLEPEGEGIEEITTLEIEIEQQEENNNEIQSATESPDVQIQTTLGIIDDDDGEDVETIVCEKEGNIADKEDCHSYYTCSLDPVDGILKPTKNSCRENQAFSVNFDICTRDISSCNIGPECLTKGKFSDPSAENSYFWCVENYNKDAFRKFKVQCDQNEVFLPAYSLCFIDLSAPFVPPTNTITDEDLVRRENKLLNGIEKKLAKDEKRRKKEEEKLQKDEEKRKRKEEKEAQKAAAKAQKEQDKKNKGNKKDESEGCIQE